MAREYTIGEASEELRVSRKTLGEWLEIEGIRTTELPQGSVDKRAHVISRRLLTTLARKHKRLLTSEMERELEEEGGRSLVTALLKELENLRTEVDGLHEQLASVPSSAQFEELRQEIERRFREIAQGQKQE